MRNDSKKLSEKVFNYDKQVETCKGKVTYKKEEWAQEMAKKKRKGRVYACTVCDWWHITTK